MEKRLVLIGDEKSFMVSSIVKELKDLSFEVISAPIDVDKIEAIQNKPSVYLVYIDEMALMRDLFIYLKDHSVEGDISLSVVGSKTDLEQVVAAEDERLQKKKILNSKLLRQN